MADKTAKVILFDLDGTLIDTSEGVLGSAAWALAELGYKSPTPKRFRGFLGPPLAECFSEVCEVRAEDVPTAVRLFREEYIGREKYLLCSVYPGIPEMLDALREAGFRIAVTTSKLESAAKKVLASKGLLDKFDLVAGALAGEGRKTKTEILHFALSELSAEPADAILVGDRCYDAEGAGNIGCGMIPALWGFGAKEEFLPYPVLFFADTPLAVSERLTGKI